jgi:endoglucanase
MDYILGRNALNISYVTGYGTRFSQNQHSRWYAHQLNPDLPHPPPGSLAGGPNSSIQDPLAQRKLAGCVGQFCYIDDIESWSTNELTINWNSPLAWVTSFLAAPPGKGACRVERAGWSVQGGACRVE